MAFAYLPSGGAREIGAKYRRGVHAGPPGCAWKHCQEKYVWTLVSFTISPHHALCGATRAATPYSKLSEVLLYGN